MIIGTKRAGIFLMKLEIKIALTYPCKVLKQSISSINVPLLCRTFTLQISMAGENKSPKNAIKKNDKK